MVAINRGNIVLVDLNPVIGTEQSGIRPAVIIQTDKANKVSPHTIIAPFSSKIRSAILPSHVFIHAGQAGIIMDSVILCEQLRVIDKKRILKFIGKLSDELTIELNSAIVAILDIK
ncbi:MAG TPA: type II toxin-antitoxin system PemK/MazF family toxin [Candidatus Kapabacteria bacterium]|nr:type II toxin-antitoxin system PemK/MazF family toxin [Candidatus Kapabacteria bacterium]HPO61597.1 type II toxin-antitoxin system PemK/MazF family toxin [Candidatus Kapabacteria bacterium]